MYAELTQFPLISHWSSAAAASGGGHCWGAGWSGVGKQQHWTGSPHPAFSQVMSGRKDRKAECGKLMSRHNWDLQGGDSILPGTKKQKQPGWSMSHVFCCPMKLKALWFTGKAISKALFSPCLQHSWVKVRKHYAYLHVNPKYHKTVICRTLGLTHLYFVSQQPWSDIERSTKIKAHTEIFPFLQLPSLQIN